MIKHEHGKWKLYSKDGAKVLGTHDTEADAMAQERAIEAAKHRTAELRQLHLRGALGAVRTEMWDGREHLVVPVVALQEAVIHAVNAKTAEFVPTASLTASVGRWNGHPLVVGHPVRDGKQISAHSPEVLATHGFGFIRQATMHGTRLGMEAMVDPARLKMLKHEQLLADLQAGKPIEVSVGAFVNTNDKTGEFGGKNYDGEWTHIEPDHLAFLPGRVGACSLAMGCGAHRAAMLVTAEGFEALGDVEGHEFHGNQYSHGAAAASDKANAATSQANKSGKASDHAAAATAHQHAANQNLKAADMKKGATAEQSDKHFGVAMEHQRAANEHTRKAGGRDFVRLHPKGLSMKSLKSRILALFDTPEQAASEEAAELIAYQSMRDLFDGVGDQWDAASKLIDALVADEEENPTITPGQEEAETEVEDARLDAIRMHCYSMIAALQSVCNACTEQQMPDAPPVSDPRYMEAFRAAVGKVISAKNMKTIQSAHDASHDMHGHTVALGAECNGMKLLASKTCASCDGTVQTKSDGKQQDCEACDGTGYLKAAAASTTVPELKAACRCEEAEMDKKARIAALLGHEPIKAWATEKTLEALDDKALETLEAQCAKNAADLKAAQDARTEAEAKLKAASEHVPTEEEWLKTAPPSFRAMHAEKQARDATDKAALVEKLVPLKALTKEQLEAKSLDELKTLAAFAKIEPVDYSGRGVAVQRAAQMIEDFTPPDAYAPGLKALTSKAVN